LKVAGAVAPIFTPAAKRELYKLTHGVPRMINVIADRAMLGAFSEETREVTPKLLRKAASEVLDRDFSPWATWRPWLARLATVGGVAGLIFAVNWALSNLSQQPPEVPVATAAMPAPAAGPATATPAPTAEDPVAAGPETDTVEPATDTVRAAGIGPLLSEQSGATDTDSAFATLFSLWGLEYDRQTTRACEQAQGDGLRCLFQRGSLAQVRNLDRPVILSLRDPDGNQHQVVLSGLDDRQALLSIGTESYTVSIEDLGQYWFGDYLLLWRPQVDGAKQFIPGMRHADIRWLRESLAAIQGEPVVPMDSELFDQDLESRVRDYQRQRRLTVDGLVGYQTQIAINTDLNQFGSPRLARVN
ncbi:MAG: peptidoglycan-binding protein, partial [Gammaproteobacteria bacterium]|nr:peptidoglycan-binding protein [Gammaproteobacteria bacterium]